LLRNSIGIWAFGVMPTRFVPGGYHRESAELDMVELTKRVAEGLNDVADGFEYHYPNEINDDNVQKVRDALGDKDIYAVALGHHTRSEFALGSFINPNPAVRREAVKLAREAVSLAAGIGAKLIIWPGAEGYNYPYQTDYSEAWDFLIDGFSEVVQYANEKGVPVLLEHKNSEPAMKILMRSIGMALYVINKIQAKGVDTSNVRVNMDWQHLIMNGEHLAEYAILLHKEGKLGHQHANSGWGQFDDDNMVGSLRFMETLELAQTLQDLGYGNEGERIGFDLFPYCENQVAAVKQSILQWRFIWSLAEKIDRKELAVAKKERNAVLGSMCVFRALGMRN